MPALATINVITSESMQPVFEELKSVKESLGDGFDRHDTVC